MFNSSLSTYFNALINQDLAYEPDDGLLEEPLVNNYTKMFFLIGSKDHNSPPDAALREISEMEVKHKEIFIHPEEGHCPLASMPDASKLYEYIFSSNDNGDDDENQKRKALEDDYKLETFVPNGFSYWIFTKGTKSKAPPSMWIKEHEILPAFPPYPIKSELFKELGELKFVDLTDPFSMREYLKMAQGILVRHHLQECDEYNNETKNIIDNCLYILDSAKQQQHQTCIIKKNVLDQISENIFK